MIVAALGKIAADDERVDAVQGQRGIDAAHYAGEPVGLPDVLIRQLVGRAECRDEHLRLSRRLVDVATSAIYRGKIAMLRTAGLRRTVLPGSPRLLEIGLQLGAYRGWRVEAEHGFKRRTRLIVIAQRQVRAPDVYRGASVAGIEREHPGKGERRFVRPAGIKRRAPECIVEFDHPDISVLGAVKKFVRIEELAGGRERFRAREQVG